MLTTIIKIDFDIFSFDIYCKWLIITDDCESNKEQSMSRAE